MLLSKSEFLVRYYISLIRKIHQSSVDLVDFLKGLREEALLQRV